MPNKNSSQKDTGILKHEDVYVIPALKSALSYSRLLPPDVRRELSLALSIIATHGMATGAELRRELGENWVIAKRTKNIVEKYGADVKCYSLKQYHQAEIRAIEKRFPKSGGAA